MCRSFPLIDRDSAANATVVEMVAEARLIYLLGGFPGYLCEKPAQHTRVDGYSRSLGKRSGAGRQQRRRYGPV